MKPHAPHSRAIRKPSTIAHSRCDGYDASSKSEKSLKISRTSLKINERQFHITTDDFERYHLGRIRNVAELCMLEDHLSWCQLCRDGDEAIGRFVKLVFRGAIPGADVHYREWSLI